jgi:hypothetical protein
LGFVLSDSTSPNKRRYVVALVVLLIGILDIPRYFVEVFRLPLPMLGGNPPYLMPMIGIGAAVAAWMSARMGRIQQCFEWSDRFFVVALLTWVWLEMANSLEAGVARPEMILTNLWAFVCLAALRQVSATVDLGGRVARIFVELLVAWVFLHLVLMASVRLGVPVLSLVVDANELVGKNSLSHVASFGILLLLFDDLRLDPWRRYCVYLPILLGVVVTNRSRGALVIVALIALLRLAREVRRLPWQVCLLGVAVAVVAAFSSRDLIGGPIERLFIGLSLDAELSPDKLLQLGDDLHSVYSRNRSNVLLLWSIIENPLSGIGMSEVQATRAGRYVSHTYWLYPLAAYGLLGSVPYVMWFLSLARRGLWRHRQHLLPYGLFVLLTMTFTNDFFSWYAVVIFLLTRRVDDVAVSHGARAAVMARARHQWIHGST